MNLLNERYYIPSENESGFIYVGRCEIVWPEILKFFEIYIIFSRTLQVKRDIPDLISLDIQSVRDELVASYLITSR